ncbi:hypothetical protein [Cystobacter fuscus]|uniref:hypothetical protein n=1 Tax=Cystobacter fuscus TaxID=43 RepID=UPI002B2B4C47|nr:hypothetical protein F0U63_22315 [Cystobacter fuscus]
MSRLRAVAAVLTLGVPFAATAADITRVASSFEDDDPFGLFIDAGVEYAQRNSRIVRETPVTPGGSKIPYKLGDAFTYGQYETRLNVDLAVGISRDVEFSFGLPLVLLQNEYWNRPAAEQGSRADLSDIDISGRTRAYRWGLGNARFGLGWAIFNQRKDDTKPTWVARLNYEAPTAPAFDPSYDTAATDRTTVGDRVHKYTLSTALSRKIGLAEPYFKVAYTIPVRGPFAYSNCDNTLGMGTPENCGKPGWSRGETGIQAPHVVGVTMGSEFQVGDRSARMLKLDARVVSNFVSAGRYYNELSGALGKLLSSSEYLQLGGQLGATFQLNEYFSFRGTAAFLYNTDHALTAESVGRDEDNNGQADSDVDRNPNFNPVWDQPGGRFYAVGSRDLHFTATINFTF